MEDSRADAAVRKNLLDRLLNSVKQVTKRPRVSGKKGGGCLLTQRFPGFITTVLCKTATVHVVVKEHYIILILIGQYSCKVMRLLIELVCTCKARWLDRELIHVININMLKVVVLI